MGVRRGPVDTKVSTGTFVQWMLRVDSDVIAEGITGGNMTRQINVNGHRKTVDVDDDTPVLWVVRDLLGLTGTKFGCGVGLCGPGTWSRPSCRRCRMRRLNGCERGLRAGVGR